MQGNSDSSDREESNSLCRDTPQRPTCHGAILARLGHCSPLKGSSDPECTAQCESLVHPPVQKLPPAMPSPHRHYLMCLEGFSNQKPQKFHCQWQHLQGPVTVCTKAHPSPSCSRPVRQLSPRAQGLPTTASSNKRGNSPHSS